MVSKLVFPCLLGSILLYCSSCQKKISPVRTKAPSSTTFTVNSQLGKPFGEILEIEGTVIDGATIGRKAYSNTTLIQVTHVQGTQLKEAITMKLSSLTNVGMMQSLSHGKTVKLLGYETGGFEGIPNEAFNHIQLFTTTGFHFSHWFEVIEIL